MYIRYMLWFVVFVVVFMFCVNDRNVLRSNKHSIRKQQPQATNGCALDFLAGFAVWVGERNQIGGGFGVDIIAFGSGNPNTGLTNTLIGTKFL